MTVDELRPVADYLVVRERVADRTRSGIILPKGENVECAYGEVVAAGPGQTNVVTGEVYPLEIKPGDIILTMQYMGEKVLQRAGDLRFIREHGVWAKLTLGDGDGMDILKCEPIKDCVLVDVDHDNVTDGGLMLPGGRQTENCKGKVIAVGGGHRNLKSGAMIKPSVEKGETVIFRRFAGAEVSVRGHKRKLRLMQDRDLVAVIVGGA